jgi:DNA-binding SARP family transcriptional activator
LQDNALRLSLLGGLEIGRARTRLNLPLGAQRLLALLALQDGWIHRSTAAERLWPDSLRNRAPANLRSALWKASRIGDVVAVESTGARLRLEPGIEVDLRSILERIRHIGDGRGLGALADEAETIIAALSRELLPDWSDEWLRLERERWDQVRTHTLESLAQQLMAAGQYLLALEAASAAVAVEPVRESAHRAVIEVYIAEGNGACALKHYQRYRGLVQRELGVTPSQRMNRLIQPLTAR